MLSVKAYFKEIKILTRRKIIKQYIKLTKPKSLKDMANYWPDLTYNNEILEFRNRVINTLPFDKFLSQHQCKKINIIGSGPSVNDLNISKLKGDNNIFLNGAISIAIEKNLPIFAFIIMDATFVKNRFDIIRSLKITCHLFLGIGAACAIAERDISILDKHKVTIFNISKGDDETFYSDGDSYFSKDLTSGVFDGGTVMSIAIQIAYHLKPQSVYLLGLDISNSNEPRFYEIKGKSLKSGLLKDYQTKILPFMQLTQKCYEKQSIKIFNCSPTSRLPYKIISYSSKFESL